MVFQGSDHGAGSQFPADGASVAARTALLSQFGSSAIHGESFEGFKVNGWNKDVIKLGSGTGTATLTPAEGARNRFDDKGTSGRFNTTASGSTWWETASSFAIGFTSAISAFGFYATDFADFGGTVSIDLLSGGVLKQTFQITPASTVADGSLLFWGFNDTTGGLYDSLRFNVAQQQGRLDFLGFDDLLFGVVTTQEPPPGDVPEPATLALAGLALAGAALGRRRRSSR